MQVHCRPDLTSVTFADISADGNGEYVCKGVRRTLVERTSGGFKVRGQVGKSFVPSKDKFILVKKYWQHVNDTDFSRRTYHLLDCNDRVHNHVALLQYQFSDTDHNVTVSSHGNSNSQRGKPFFRLRPSVRAKLATRSLSQTPEQACHDLIAEKGGIQCVSLNELPNRE